MKGVNNIISEIKKYVIKLNPMEYNGPGSSLNPNNILGNPESPDEEDEAEKRRQKTAEAIAKRLRGEEEKQEKDAKKEQKKQEKQNKEQERKSKQEELPLDADNNPKPQEEPSAENPQLNVEEQPVNAVDDQELDPNQQVNEAVSHVLERDGDIEEEVADAEQGDDRVLQAAALTAKALMNNLIEKLRGIDSVDSAEQAVQSAKNETINDLELPQVITPNQEAIIDHGEPAPTDVLATDAGGTTATIEEGAHDPAGQVNDAEQAPVDEDYDGGPAIVAPATQEQAPVYAPVPKPEVVAKKPDAKTGTVGGAFAGALAGYVFGREASTKQVKKLETEVGDLKKQQDALQQRIDDQPKPLRPLHEDGSRPPEAPLKAPKVVESIQRQEQFVRRVASSEAEKQQPKQQERSVQALREHIASTAPETAKAKKRLEQEMSVSSQSREFLPRANAAGELIAPEARGEKKDPRFYSLREVLDVANTIPAQETSLKNLFQRGVVSEAGMRKIVELKQRGFDVRRTIGEVINTDRHEMLKSEPPVQLTQAASAYTDDQTVNDQNQASAQQTQSSTGINQTVFTNSDPSLNLGQANTTTKQKKISRTAFNLILTVVFVCTLLVLLALFG